MWISCQPQIFTYNDVSATTFLRWQEFFGSWVRWKRAYIEWSSFEIQDCLKYSIMWYKIYLLLHLQSLYDTLCNNSIAATIYQMTIHTFLESHAINVSTTDFHIYQASATNIVSLMKFIGFKSMSVKYQLFKYYR